MGNKNQDFIGLPYTFLWLSDVFILHFELEVEMDHNLFSALEPRGSGQGLLGRRAGDFSPTVQLPPSSLWHALGNFEIALWPDPLCLLPRRTGEGGAVWTNRRLILISALPLWA